MLQPYTINNIQSENTYVKVKKIVPAPTIVEPSREYLIELAGKLDRA